MSVTSQVVTQGLNAFGTYSAYKYDKENGKSVGYTVAKLAAEAALIYFVPGAGLAMLGGALAGGAISLGAGYAQGSGRQNASSVNNVYRNSIGGNFKDTENAQTMRQRGMQAIGMSGNNLNQVFGSEARTFYRGMS